MKNNFLSIMMLSLSLLGCTSPFQGHDLNQPQTKMIHTVNLAPGCLLKLDGIWPLQGKGTYLQNVKIRAQDQEHTLTVHITLSSDLLDFIAFDEAVGRLYQLTWTPHNLTWQASEHLPDTLAPENVLGDFLLVHLTQEELQRNLEGAIVSEEKDERFIQSSERVIRKISRRNLIESLWQDVSIHNPLIGYTLDIQTVPAP